MKSLRTLTFLAVFVLVALPVIAHHPAADIVDEDIYAMIDEMVSDTPHGDLVLSDMGGGMTEIDITARVGELEDLVDDGLLTYVSMLDGDVTLTIDFTGDRSVSLTIVQVEDPGETDKSGISIESTSLGELKASYR